jgi:XTP/dITP diphosphohydrolase
MTTLIIASNNLHKVKEISPLIPDSYRLVSLADAGIYEEIPETADTLEGNAAQKAHFVYQRTGKNCFADDTGLEVEALHGLPGVISARYAGPGCSFDDNVNKLLKAMDGMENRKARFRTIICLVMDGKDQYFEGVVNGFIISEKRGNEGFGYDPVFVPEGHNKSFAQMTLQEKNLLSHRAMAVNKLIAFLGSCC